jgi:hypothetical protein
LRKENISRRNTKRATSALNWNYFSYESTH